MTSTDPLFRRAFLGTVAVLAILCLVFLGLTWFQGPKLESVGLSTAGNDSTGGSLRLYSNQELAHVEPAQVVVSPAVDFSVDTSGEVVTIAFEQPLAAEQHYTVDVSGVTSRYQDQSADWHHEFTTETSVVHFLDRADPAVGGEDQIMESSLGSAGASAGSPVYSASGIIDFAVVGEALAVVRGTEPDRSSLELVSLVDGAVESIELPGEGSIDELRAGPENSLGFRFTSAADAAAREFSKSLLWMDVAGSHTPTPVAGLDGLPVEAADWRFIAPDGRLLVLGADNSLLELDPAGVEPPLPLGSFDGLDDVAGDGRSAIVRDAYDTMLLSLEDFSEEPFGPSPIDGVFPYGGQLELLVNGPERVQKVGVFDVATNRFSSKITIDDGVASRVIYEPATDEAGVGELSVSPSGQYVAIELTPDVGNAISDEYYPFARPTSIVTKIVDVASGRTVSELAGFAVRW